MDEKKSPSLHYPVVIVGGGFAGAYCGKYLARELGTDASTQVALIADQNVLAFQPMLAEVAGASLAPTDVVTPLRVFCPGISVLQGKIMEIDLPGKHLVLDAGQFTSNSTITFDHLVLALGGIVDVSRVPGMAEHGYVLKEVADALRLRIGLIERLEEANLCTDQEEKRRLLTFVVVGGGYSGVEMAGQILDLLASIHPLYSNLRDTPHRVVLVHSGEHILPEIGPKLGDYAQGKLKERGLEFILQDRVASVTASKVFLSKNPPIETHMVVSTVGNAPHPLVTALCEQNKLETLKGRVVTEPSMQVKGQSTLWAIGDGAAIPLDGKPSCSPTAQFAVRQGIQVAKNVARALKNEPLKPFAYKEQGQLAAIGHRTAVAQIMGIQISGFIAWFIWRTIYLSKMPTLNRKLRVVIDWTLDLFFPRDVSVVLREHRELISHPHLEKDDMLMEEGDPYRCFYIVKSGSVACYRGTELYRTLHAGDGLGGRDFTNHHEWTVRAVVAESTDLISVQRQVWHTLLTSKVFAEHVKDLSPTDT